MNQLTIPTIISIVAGLIVLITPKRIRGLGAALSLITSFVVFLLTIKLFFNRPLELAGFGSKILLLDNLSSFIVLFVGLFGLLVILYSLSFMKGREDLNQFYSYMLWTIGASIGAALSNNLILFIIFWGFLAITLYLLINLGSNGANKTAQKAFIIIGGTDALMLFGIAIIWRITGTFDMHAISIPLRGSIAVVAYLSLVAGAFAKAGVMPFHTWVPDTAKDSPVPVAAFLPASLDKLLGIYFLARISLDLFVMNMAMRTLLMGIGSFTIVAAVMMALIQHDFKRLLGYHAVSQAGYMVLGIGTGTLVGIAGGLFHMLNNAIYKYSLFLSGGAVEKQAGTTDLEKLGGLSRLMPISFMTCLIASLAISGVPPLNGFFSKWMIYQGVIQLGRQGERLWVIWLAAAMFGSALTLASFMKLIHATFLGQRTPNQPQATVKEVDFKMWLPMVILAGLCIIFGVFAYRIPLRFFVNPSVGETVPLSGLWSSSLATLLILVGIGVGFIIYILGTIKTLREDEPYVGGAEVARYKEMRVSGVEFYETIRETPILKGIYKSAENKLFDIYEQGKKATFLFTRIFQNLHNGILPTYLVWCLLGMIVLLFVLMR